MPDVLTYFLGCLFIFAVMGLFITADVMTSGRKVSDIIDGIFTRNYSTVRVVEKKDDEQ